MTLEIRKNWTFNLIVDKFITILIIAALFMAVLGEFVFKKQDEKQIKENLGITSGEVIKVFRGGTKSSVLKAYFRYGVDSAFYESNRSVSSSRVLGHRFPVVYSRKEPLNCRMLIKPGDFEKFGLAFPDSLR